MEMKTMKNNGMTISAIAREAGHDRKTVRKYLMEKLKIPEYKKRERPPSILDPYKDTIRRQVGDYNISATKAFEDVQALGYKGKYTIVKEFVRTLKKDKGIQAVIRFETGPGLQAQVDWSDNGTVAVDGGVRKLYAFTMVLAFSRAKYMECTFDTTTETFIKCHLNAFAHFGGFTKDILYDNTKNVILKRALLAKDHEWNHLFKDFFMHFGFVPRLCRPYRPQTKGKVENVVKFEKGDFFIDLVFVSLQDTNARALAWLRKVDSKPHGTTGIPPLVRLEEERALLTPLVGIPPYKIIQKFDRKIPNDCYVSYLGNKYSVPYQYAGRNVTLLVHDGKFEAEIAGKTICTHEVKMGSGGRVRVKEHFAGLLKEIMDYNRIPQETPQIQTKLPIVPVVEQRSLEVYDQFCDLKSGVDK